MNEKKLTDEKIIKAFEVCYFGNESCSACPYEINDIDCTERRSVKDMFDLFNRQKSEIEQLKNDYIELDLECRKLRAELDKELAEHEEFTKKAQEEIESLKSKSSYKDSWRNKFFKAQEEVERLNQGYDMLNYESARKEEYIETLKKQVDELKEERENMSDEIFSLEQQKEDLYFQNKNLQTYIDNHEPIWKRNAEQAVKDTAKEILSMFDDRNYISENELKKAIAERYGTKECEQCNCGGDRKKCDFYEEVRNGRAEAN